ncbi:hypothetical protein NDU88_007432 [Pleurodeles waltl]|uniref:Uncharacterized protein n=1 Tax=Pleurodeles waltl TaxID=8319 RepID=A0AAV7QNR7_PLEWA|nr:hypothetical protein NDU88_007432 [Pleurodeles waltl]
MEVLLAQLVVEEKPEEEEVILPELEQDLANLANDVSSIEPCLDVKVIDAEWCLDIEVHVNINDALFLNVVGVLNINKALDG